MRIFSKGIHVYICVCDYIHIPERLLAYVRAIHTDVNMYVRTYIHTGERKHHCRNCGQGFCGTCSEGRACVPNRGWHTPVRVCGKCMQWLASCEDVASALETAPASTPRDTHDGDQEARNSAAERKGENGMCVKGVCAVFGCDVSTCKCVCVCVCVCMCACVCGCVGGCVLVCVGLWVGVYLCVCV